MNKKYTKICSVCGDKAYSYNFGAISCESCKSFFRRHTSKQFEYKCRFDGNCAINKRTRRICSQCRLSKCFDVGMTQENKTNRDIKQLKAMDRNDNWIDLNMRSISDESTTGVYDSSSHSNDNQTKIPLDLNDLYDNNYAGSIGSANNILGTKSDNSSEGLDLNINIIFNDSVNENTIEIDNSVNSEERHQISDNIEKQLELSVIPVSQFLHKSNFNELESNYIIELLNCTISCKENKLPESTVIMNSVEDLVQLLILKFEVYVEDIVCLSKRLSPFKQMCETDQLILLKQGVVEILCMFSAKHYNCGNQCWTLNLDTNNAILFNLDILKQCRRNIYEPAKRYMEKFQSEWNEDKFILDLLMAIILFDPNRPNLVHKELVKLQQKIYMYLLQRYLTMRCGDEVVAQSKFNRIINALQELYILNQAIRGKEFGIDCSGPLFREIMDFK